MIVVLTRLTQTRSLRRLGPELGTQIGGIVQSVAELVAAAILTQSSLHHVHVRWYAYLVQLLPRFELRRAARHNVEQSIRCQ